MIFTGIAGKHNNKSAEHLMSFFYELFWLFVHVWWFLVSYFIEVCNKFYEEFIALWIIK